MARKVFYSFHYEHDAWRAAQVRNSNAILDEDEFGVIDAVDWEKIERDGDDAIKRWINSQLKDTSVTVVLIGKETDERPWVEYEIRRSWERGNALVGIRIHNVKNQDGETDPSGPNPFDRLKFTDGKSLSSVCKTYDWVADKGRQNMGDWVETAYQERADLEDDKILQEGEKRAMVKAAACAAPAPTVIRNPARPWAC